LSLPKYPKKYHIISADKSAAAIIGNKIKTLKYPEAAKNEDVMVTRGPSIKTKTNIIGYP